MNKGLILKQQHVQIREYYFHEEGSRWYYSRYRSKFDFVSSYAEQRRKALNNTKYFSQGEKVSISTIVINSHQGFREEHP